MDASDEMNDILAQAVIWGFTGFWVQGLGQGGAFPVGVRLGRRLALGLLPQRSM